ncbi:MAG: hypothetical protein ACTSRJ_04555 [Candidatus Hodarchaeales archaeon]
MSHKSNDDKWQVKTNDQLKLITMTEQLTEIQQLIQLFTQRAEYLDRKSKTKLYLTENTTMKMVGSIISKDKMRNQIIGLRNSLHKIIMGKYYFSPTTSFISI